MDYSARVRLIHYIVVIIIIYQIVGSVQSVKDNSALTRQQRPHQNSSVTQSRKRFLHSLVVNVRTNHEQKGHRVMYHVPMLNSHPLIDDDECRHDIEKIVLAYEQNEPWALKIYDSIGKVRSGVLHRSMRYWGDFDGCLSVESNQTFQTNYCLSTIFVWRMEPFVWKNPQYMELGLCVPSTCDNKTVTKFLNLYISKQSNVTGVALSSICQERSLPLTAGGIVTIMVCAAIGVLMLISTLYDVFGTKYLAFTSSENDKRQDRSTWLRNNGQENSVTETSDQEPILVMARKKRHHVLKGSRHIGVGGQLLLSFSVVRNGSKLLSTSSNHRELLCINGLRVLSMAFILLGHVLAGLVKLSNNGLDYLFYMKRRYSYHMSMAYMSVDTFFVLRLTPPYCLVLVTYTQLFKYFSEGPIWPQNGLDEGECYEFPWNSLLYINNFVGVGPWCMNWSWYLAVDMQFFVIFPIVLLPLYYFEWRGLAVPILLTIGSGLAAGVISYSNHLLPYMDPLAEKTSHEYMTLMYLKPYTRYAPYAIGMMTGYVLEKHRCRARLSKTIVAVGWSLCFLALFMVIFAIHIHENYTPMNREVTAFYSALSKPVWAMGVAWVIFACSTGYGGPANSILSWRFFSPCGRLTYMVYLIHLVITNYYLLSLTESIYVEALLSLYFHFAGFFAISYGLAFLFTLAFEAPFANILKFASQRRRKQLQSIEESRM